MSTATSQSPWIRSPIYDLSFVMGGAFFTLLVAAAVAVNPRLLPLFFWVWLIGFEGTHFWATFSRTYIDKDFRAKNPGVLVGSSCFFILPVFAIVADGRNGHMAADAYGFFIFLWSLYHNARQHYGFTSIYNKKAGTSADLVKRITRLVYLSVAAPQIYFVLNHRAKLSYPAMGEWFAPTAPLGVISHWLPIVVSAYALIMLGATFFEARRNGGGLVPLLYVAVCWLFYSAMFYVVAPAEPFFSAHANNAQIFMLIAIMNSLFHNIQYHAIVWYYGSKRYAETTGRFGVARRVNHHLATYSSVALFFGVVFGVIVFFLGDWPSWTGTYAQAPFNPWSYCLYFGIVGHHFYLDQRIWRPSQQAELRTYLGVDRKVVLRPAIPLPS